MDPSNWPNNLRERLKPELDKLNLPSEPKSIPKHDTGRERDKTIEARIKLHKLVKANHHFTCKVDDCENKRSKGSIAHYCYHHLRYNNLYAHPESKTIRNRPIAIKSAEQFIRDFEQSETITWMITWIATVLNCEMLKLPPVTYRDRGLINTMKKLKEVDHPRRILSRVLAMYQVIMESGDIHPHVHPRSPYGIRMHLVHAFINTNKLMSERTSRNSRIALAEKMSPAFMQALGNCYSLIQNLRSKQPAYFRLKYLPPERKN